MRPRGPLTFTPTQRSLSLLFSLLGAATGTFKAKTLSCQSPDPELEMVPAPVQAPLTLTPEEVERKEANGCSYQQINCLDGILRSGYPGTFSHLGPGLGPPQALPSCPLAPLPRRYLESCNIPSTTKRKCASSSCTTSSASDDDKQRTGPLPLGAKKGKDPVHALSPLPRPGPLAQCLCISAFGAPTLLHPVPLPAFRFAEFSVPSVLPRLLWDFPSDLPGVTCHLSAQMRRRCCPGRGPPHRRSRWWEAP